jgi:hypothetical protein
MYFYYTTIISQSSHAAHDTYRAIRLEQWRGELVDHGSQASCQPCSWQCRGSVRRTCLLSPNGRLMRHFSHTSSFTLWYWCSDAFRRPSAPSSEGALSNVRISNTSHGYKLLSDRVLCCGTVVVFTSKFSFRNFTAVALTISYLFTHSLVGPVAQSV